MGAMAQGDRTRGPRSAAEVTSRRRILPASILPLQVDVMAQAESTRELEFSRSSMPWENKPFCFSNSPLMGAMAWGERTRGLKCSGSSKPFYFSNLPLMGAMARVERTRGLKCSGSSIPLENKPFYFSNSPLMGAMARVERTRGSKCSGSNIPLENKPF